MKGGGASRNCFLRAGVEEELCGKNGGQLLGGSGRTLCESIGSKRILEGKLWLHCIRVTGIQGTLMGKI